MFQTVPIAIRWKIPVEKLKRASQKQNWRVRGKKFEVETLGVEYGLIVGESLSSTTKYFIWLDIINEINGKTVDCKTKISIMSANISFGINKKCGNDKNWGKTFCLKEDLFDSTKNFIVNGFLTIFMEGTLTGENVKPEVVSVIHRRKNHDLGPLMWNRDDKDFAFVVDGKVIKVSNFFY